MARCNCSGQVCSCKIEAGTNITITGAGSSETPFTISAADPGGGVGVPTGVWLPFGGSAAPAGFLLCNGQAVSRTTFAALFNVIGTRFGAGDGFNTFNVPDITDRFPVGAGGQYPAGSVGGQAGTTLSIANLPPHTHGLNNHTHSLLHDHPAFDTKAGGDHRHKLQMSGNDGGSDNTVRQGPTSGHDTSAAVETTGSHTHTVNVPAFTGNSGTPNPASTASTGSAAAIATVPPYVASNYIIKT